MVHLALRVLPIAAYLLLWIVTNNFILMFVVILLALATEFWFIKNVSGRKLVALRWWNQVRPDGSDHWIFESKRV